ncbi:hypothetical protein ElyMa_000127600 [Elysia marginata]|uniref:Uncharacterized protein n=1 Tax=Elysia marginata TaxID=1093978 RepID=A0AAV4EQ42_9GAST|nr:hypothetical protein ElyMa_000127600 [Elysia marginata]
MERYRKTPDGSWERQREVEEVGGRSLFPIMIQDTACSPAWAHWPGEGLWRRSYCGWTIIISLWAGQKTVTGADWCSSLGSPTPPGLAKPV